MEVSNFFTRLLTAPKPATAAQAPDSLQAFDAAWNSVRSTLEHPDERQLARGIGSTDVPKNLKHIVDALVYESNRTDEDTTGACLEYFLRHDMLGQLERLCQTNRPRGIKDEVVRAANNLVVLMSERFLVHNAVHRPLRRLIRACVGDAPSERVDGAARVVGAAASGDDFEDFVDFEEDLVDLMCILCSRLRAYPPLLLIFFHDRGWLVPHNSSGAPGMPSMGVAMSSPGSRTLSTPPRNTVPSSPNVLSPVQMQRTLSPSPSIATGRSGRSARSGETSMSDPSNTHFEFLLFRYLLRFVHREGRIGDFARAGLLFLFDIAFLAPGDEGGDTLAMPSIGGQDPLQDARDAMAEYILDSDFADIMAAGLGATYSILPTKLRVPTLAEQVESDPDATNGAMYLGAGDKKPSANEYDDDDIFESNDIDVHAQLDLLIRLFGFLQDILYRCHSPLLYADPGAEVTSTQVLGPAVASATLEAVQKTFVDNVLYPSILECSSNDGSAVAILTYLDVLLTNLEDGPVLHRIVDVLMDANAPPPSLSSPKKKKQRKTGAMAYVAPFAAMAPGNVFLTDERFTLRDLILDNLRSSSEPAASAALHLLATLLSDHCRHVTSKLLMIKREPTATALARPSLPPPEADTWQTTLPEPVNSTDAHLQEPELYSGLIPKLDDVIQSSVDVIGFASYLADAEAFLEADGCWRSSRVPLEFVADDGHPTLLRMGEYDNDPLQHQLSPSDPLVRQLMTALGEWFASPPDQNVALTGALSALARCPHRSLTGWLLYDVPREADPWDALSVSSEDSVDARRSGAQSRADDPFSHVTLPALYQILRQLVKQVGAFRGLEGFDRLLAERRQGLLFADHLEESIALMDADKELPATPKQKGGLAKLKALWSSPGLKRKVSGVSTPPPAPAVPSTPQRTPGSRRGTLSAPQTPGTPSPASAASASPKTPGTPGAPSPSAAPASVPFKTHYAGLETAVDVSPAQPPQQGPWAPAALELGGELADLTLGDASMSVSMSASVSGTETDGDTLAAPERRVREQMSLSAVLDNCIVLEELVKELVAVIVARRAMGVDQVGYV